MSDRDAAQLDRKMDRVERWLPKWAARSLHWLRAPSSRWVRVPIALLLIAGGLASFLPGLGIELIPLGLLLLAQDVPLLRKPMLRLLTWLEQAWGRLKRFYYQRRCGATKASNAPYSATASKERIGGIDGR